MRLIDAERIVYSWIIDKDGEEHDGITLQSIIDKMPTVDAEPVKHGYWEWTDDPRTGDFVCSNCLEHNIVCSRYCPNCGAIMDGERKEDVEKTN